MKYSVMSIFDSGIAAYGVPFHVNHRQYALRYFENLARDPKSDISKYPSSFHLFELGEFDDETGQITMHQNPISLGLASSFLNQEV